jgi:hypothetical protein
MKRTNTAIQGVGFLVLSLLTFSLQDIAVKWIGALLTVSSGIYIVYREQREQHAATRSMPPIAAPAQKET